MARNGQLESRFYSHYRFQLECNAVYQFRSNLIVNLHGHSATRKVLAAVHARVLGRQGFT